MQRSLKFIPNETWYYYTFYNTYDDEQREYRYERHSKLVEQIHCQAKSRCEEQYPRSKHNSSFIYRIPIINNDVADKNVEKTETLEVVDTINMETQNDHIYNVSPMLYALEDQKISPFRRMGEFAVQLVENTTVIIFQAPGYNCNFLSVIMYPLLQYEKLMKIITLPKVATGMLICDLILLVLILY